MECRIVDDGIIGLTGLFAEITADKIHGAVLFVYFPARHRLRAGIGMIVSGEYRIDPGGIHGRRQDIVISVTAAVRVRIVSRLVDAQDLPGAVGSLRIADEPLRRLAELCTVVDHGEIDIAVLYGIIIPRRLIEDRVCQITGRIAIVLVVAERMRKGKAAEILLEQLQQFVPVVIAAAVIDEVAGLQREVELPALHLTADLLQDGNGIGIRSGAAAHLRIADDEERDLTALGSRRKAHRVGPRAVRAVADKVIVGRAGLQIGQAYLIDERGILGDRECRFLTAAAELHIHGLAEIEGIGRASGAQRIFIARGRHIADHSLLLRGSRIGEPADAGLRAAVLYGVLVDIDRLSAAAGMRKHRTLRRKRNAERAACREGVGRPGRQSGHGIGHQLTGRIRFSDLRSVQENADIRSRLSVAVKHGDGAAVALRLHTGNDGIICRQCKLAVGLCGRVARAVDRRIADGHRLIGEEIDLRVKIRRDAERDGAQLCPRRLLAALRLQMQGGLAEARLLIGIAAGVACRECNGRLAELRVELCQLYGGILQGIGRRQRQGIGTAHRDGVTACKADLGRLRIAADRKAVVLRCTVAKRIEHGDADRVDAVVQAGIGTRLRRGLIGILALAVDGDDRRFRVDAAPVFAFGVVVVCDQLHIIAVQDRGAVLGKLCAVDRRRADHGVDKVIHIRAVYNTDIVKIEGAVVAAAAVLRLVGQPDQALARFDLQRMLRTDHRPDPGEIRIAVHPAGPGDPGLTGIHTLQRKILCSIVAAVPCGDLNVRRVLCRSLRGIDPDADLTGIALDIDVFSAVADVIVCVAGAVIGGIVIVQLHGGLAEAHLTCVRSCDLQLAAVILGQRGRARPQVEVIAVCTENICSRNGRIKVAGEAERCGNGRAGRRAAVFSAGDHLDRIHSAAVALRRAVVDEIGAAPVIMRALCDLAVLVGLKVKQDDRHFADLDLDVGAELLPAERRMRHRHLAGQRAVGLCSREQIAGKAAQRIIIHTPAEIAGMGDDAAPVGLYIEAEVRACTEVQRNGLAGEIERIDLSDHDRGAADDGLAAAKLHRHGAGVARGCREQAVCIHAARCGIRHAPLQALRQLCLAACGIDTDCGELHAAARRILLVVRAQDGVVKFAGRLRSGDEHQCTGDRALRPVGGAVADNERILALSLRGIRRRAAAIQIKRIRDALRQQELRQLIQGLADRIRVLSAVRDEGDDRAVRLQADAVARHQRRILRADNDLTAAHEEERAGNGLLHIAAVRSGIAQRVAAVLQNGEIRLAAPLDHIALHNEVAERLRSLHVVVIAVCRENDIFPGRGLIGGGLLRSRLQIPLQILCSLFAAGSRAALRIVSGIGCAECHIRIRRDRRQEACDLRLFFFLIEDHLRLRYAGDELITRCCDQLRIGRLLHLHRAGPRLGGNCGRLHCSGRNGRKQRNRKHKCQQAAQYALHLCVHEHHSFEKCVRGRPPRHVPDYSIYL